MCTANLRVLRLSAGRCMVSGKSSISKRNVSHGRTQRILHVACCIRLYVASDVACWMQQRAYAFLRHSRRRMAWPQYSEYSRNSFDVSTNRLCTALLRHRSSAYRRLSAAVDIRTIAESRVAQAGGADRGCQGSNCTCRLCCSKLPLETSSLVGMGERSKCVASWDRC